MSNMRIPSGMSIVKYVHIECDQHIAVFVFGTGAQKKKQFWVVNQIFLCLEMLNNTEKFPKKYNILKNSENNMNIGPCYSRLL